MKKIYIAPEMDVVELDMFQPILTGSLPLDSSQQVEDPEEILAPGFSIENELFGF